MLAKLSRVEDGVERSLAAGRVAVLLDARGSGRSMAVTESFTRSAGHCDGCETRMSSELVTCQQKKSVWAERNGVRLRYSGVERYTSRYRVAASTYWCRSVSKKR